MNILLIWYTNIVVSQAILIFKESSNRDNFEIEIFIYKENVSTFDIYKFTDKKSVPYYINTTSKSVRQNNSVAVMCGNIRKCDTNYLSRYIIVIFFNDGSFCVTPSFDLSYVIRTERAFSLYYQRYYTNPLELIQREIN